MQKLLSKHGLAVLALLCSSTGYAATVTISMSENSGTANDGLVNVGDTFSLLISGQGFPDSVGATLKLFFNSAAVAVTQPTLTAGIVLAPGSPFTGGIFNNAGDPFVSGDVFVILAPSTGPLPSGSFNAFVINFTALAVGFAGVQIADDQADFSWTDSNLMPIPVSYTGPPGVSVIPVPAAAWLFGSALGLLGVARRRVIAGA